MSIAAALCLESRECRAHAEECRIESVLGLGRVLSNIGQRPGELNEGRLSNGDFELNLGQVAITHAVQELQCSKCVEAFELVTDPAIRASFGGTDGTDFAEDRNETLAIDLRRSRLTSQ